MPRTFLIVVFISLCTVFCNNVVKSLTESRGQEVIEIGSPIKELPADLEEEPSIENEEDEHVTTSTTTTTKLTTKKEVKKEVKKDTNKPNVVVTIHPQKPNAILTNEEEEAKIEKELSEIYKDTVYYRDSAESTLKSVTKPVQNTTLNLSTLIARRNNNKKENFQFQPEPFNKAEIERFRTSVDDISCGKKLKAGDDVKVAGTGYNNDINILMLNFSLLLGILF
ncbi:uncharacterized protein LOC132903573 [Amyelois transitella]|uniref:uncharacterized protein LOC132903573 n=1 Tax=Amyelois transitella TaxID=680683 RepID=UPI00298F9F5E|nr:uncharacterized protein LOC132903573 [Amyelois transitella]